jgi:hypothetical protein
VLLLLPLLLLMMLLLLLPRTLEVVAEQVQLLGEASWGPLV